MTKMNNTNNSNKNESKNREMFKMKNNTISKKLSAALKAAGYTTSTFVLACAEEAEARRQAAAKAAKRAAAIAAKKARDEERLAKDAARRAKAAARRAKKAEKSALDSWKASTMADKKAAIAADVKVGKAWEESVKPVKPVEVIKSLMLNGLQEALDLLQKSKADLLQAEEEYEKNRTEAYSAYSSRVKTGFFGWGLTEEDKKNNEEAEVEFKSKSAEIENAFKAVKEKHQLLMDALKYLPSAERCCEYAKAIDKLLQQGYTIYAEVQNPADKHDSHCYEIDTVRDFKLLLKKSVIVYAHRNYQEGRLEIEGVFLDANDTSIKEEDAYTFVDTSFEECKQALLLQVESRPVNSWRECTVDLLSTNELDDNDNIVAERVAVLCPICGKLSEEEDGGDENNYYETLDSFGQYYVNEKGEHVGVIKGRLENELICPDCKKALQKEEVAKVNSAEELIFVAAKTQNGGVNESKRCPKCGKESIHSYCRHSNFCLSSIRYEVRLVEGSISIVNLDNDEMCDNCQTVYYGGGLDGVKDNIVVNHGLWAFRKGENNVHGALQRFREFLSLSETVEFCTTEQEQFCGDFGVTIEHPDIKAAFDYTCSDAWSERDEEDSDKRYATRNFHAGLKNRKAYNDAVKDHLAYGNNACQYVELIVRMGKNASLLAMWIKEDFAVGHPHFFKALTDIAQDTGVQMYVLKFTDSELQGSMEASEYCAVYWQHGIDSAVNSIKVEGDTWGHFGLEESRPWLRAYLFNLLARRADQIAQRDRKATIVCGLPGSGKSTYVRGLDGYYTVDPDVVKWLLPEYNGGDATNVCRESSKIASWVLQYLAVKGYNVAIPMVGDNGSLKIVAHVLRECGYDITAHFVDTDPEECARRCTQRKRTMSVSVEKLQQQRQQIMKNLNVFLGLI